MESSIEIFEDKLVLIAQENANNGGGSQEGEEVPGVQEKNE
jgi:hypothetical protein